VVAPVDGFEPQAQSVITPDATVAPLLGCHLYVWTAALAALPKKNNATIDKIKIYLQYILKK